MMYSVAHRLALFYCRLADVYLDMFHTDEIRRGSLSTQLLYRHLYDDRLDMLKAIASILLNESDRQVFDLLIERSDKEVQLATAQHDKEIIEQDEGKE